MNCCDLFTIIPQQQNFNLVCKFENQIRKTREKCSCWLARYCLSTSNCYVQKLFVKKKNNFLIYLHPFLVSNCNKNTCVLYSLDSHKYYFVITYYLIIIIKMLLPYYNWTTLKMSTGEWNIPRCARLQGNRNVSIHHSVLAVFPHDDYQLGWPSRSRHICRRYMF